MPKVKFAHAPSAKGLAGEIFVYPPLVESFDPNDFFRPHETLALGKGFKSLILSKARPVERLDEVIGHRFVTQDASTLNPVLIRQLPSGYAFDESEGCARIAQLLLPQLRGQEGRLLIVRNNEQAIPDGNLFYLSGLVVGVCWVDRVYGWSSPRDRYWWIDAWDATEQNWPPQVLFYSPV